MKTFPILLISILITFTTFAQTGIPVPEMASCDNLVTQFLNKHSIPSATMAMAKDGKLIYMRGFGNADIAGTSPTQPHHMFRIASISKPITSIAVMKMIESGNLNLSDKVFGTGGILGNHSFLSNANVTDNRIFDITVQHLLEHTGGWDRGVWTQGNGSGRVLIAKEGSEVDKFPLDGIDYVGDTGFGKGDDLGGGNFVVYEGNGSSATLTGLDPSKTYHFKLFDYNQNTTSGQHALYQLCDYAIGSATTATNTGLADLIANGIRFYPNPATDRVMVELTSVGQCDQVLLRNLQGSVVRNVSVSGNQISIDVQDLPGQVYLLSFRKDGGFVGSAKVFKR